MNFLERLPNQTKNKKGARAPNLDINIKILPNSKRSQGWGLDLVIAGVIFLAGVIVLYLYAINYSSQSQRNLEELFFEGGVASELLLSDSNIGIITDNKVNQTKLDSFQANYNMKKEEYGLVHDFYFYMGGLEINGNPVSYAGRMNASEVDNSVQITRVAIYKNKPVKLQLYVWS